ncbi:MAG: hypothetical protein Q9207_007567, partial [Kuettlingeria erythrocarpa]
MPTPKRQSPRAAIKEWLAHTEKSSVEEKQIAVTREREGAIEKERRRSSERTAGESRHPQGRLGEVYQNLDYQVHAISEGKANKHGTSHNLADQLGLHAPFRSLATRGADAQPEPARLDHERRKRRHTPSSTSSYLEPAACFRKGTERPKGQEDAQPRRGDFYRQHTSIDATSSHSDTPEPPKKRAKTYERRPRHKTREDRYELKDDKKRSRNRKNDSEVQKVPKKKRKKRKGKSGAALMHGFSAKNIEAERLTDAPKDNPPHGKLSRRKRDKAADADAEISRFFATSNHRIYEAGASSSGGKSGNRPGIAADKMRQQDQSSIAPVNLPEKPFLGFGSVGPGYVSSNAVEEEVNNRPLLCRSPSSRSTTYFTWSQTQLSRRSPSRRASQLHGLSRGTPGLEHVSESPARGRLRTSPTAADHIFQGRSQTPSSKHRWIVHHTNMGHNSSDPALGNDRSQERVQTKDGAEQGSERRNKLQTKEENQRTHDVASPKSSLAALLAAQNQPESLGAVLDRLLERVTDSLNRNNEGGLSSKTIRNTSVDKVRVSEAFPEARQPVSRPIVSTTGNESEVAARSFPAYESYQSQPLDSSTRRSAERLLPDTSHLQLPFSEARESQRFRKEQDTQHLDDGNRPFVQTSTVPSNSNTAWTGYQNLYQGQIGAMDQSHQDNNETIAEEAYVDYDYASRIRGEASFPGAEEQFDCNYIVDELQWFDAQPHREYSGAEGIETWDHAGAQMHDHFDALDQPTPEGTFDVRQELQEPTLLNNTQPSTEHTGYLTAEQGVHGGAETSDGLATPSFLGARAFTVSNQ